MITFTVPSYQILDLSIVTLQIPEMNTPSTKLEQGSYVMIS